MEEEDPTSFGRGRGGPGLLAAAIAIGAEGANSGGRGRGRGSAAAVGTEGRTPDAGISRARAPPAGPDKHVLH
ncbi:hypothetical protein E2562_022987 [Oryza meyeriana var. granulata]|uniref:Uncharacterized protein n=1 Tax=Oryza meyeriana var. granulata TaxID=110450 RepID=A0A6G1EYG8_9ORYZ|nr:hypothetical protein E2562_022987 [Oryza meyeriana var. granulata]